MDDRACHCENTASLPEARRFEATDEFVDDEKRCGVEGRYVGFKVGQRADCWAEYSVDPLTIQPYLVLTWNAIPVYVGLYIQSCCKTGCCCPSMCSAVGKRMSSKFMSIM